MDDVDFATLPEAQRRLGVSRSRLYLLLGQGDLRAKKLGNRTLLDMRHARAFINSLPDAAIRAHGPAAKHTA